jgi:predicted esterase
VDVPRLDLVAAPAGSRDLVLLAHGGQEHSVDHPSDWRTPLLRMWSFARAAAQAGPGAAVGLLRYRYRGWNDDAADAAADLRTVLDRVDYDRVLLVGHSMGGRAVTWLANHDKVCGVLALAPWLPESDPLVAADDRIVVLAHGNQDRITAAALTARYAAKLRATGATVASYTVAGDTHAMLRRHGDWDELVCRVTRQTLGLPGPTLGLPGPTLGLPGASLGDALDTDPSRPVDQLPTWSRKRGRTGAIVSIAFARFRLPVIGTC